MGGALNLALKVAFVDAVSGGLDRLSSKLDVLGDKAESVKRDFAAMTSHFAAGTKSLLLAKAAGAAMVRPGVEAAASYEQAAIRLQSNLQTAEDTTESINKKMRSVRKTAIEVGNVTPFSDFDMASVMNELVKGGVKFDQVLGDTGATAATAALATLEGISDPAALATAVVRMTAPFKDVVAGDYMGFMDDLQRASSVTSTNVMELSEALKYSGGTAARLKIDPKQWMDITAATSAGGVVGSMAGTGGQEFLSNLAMKSRYARKQVETVNAAVREATGDKDFEFKFFTDTGDFIGIEDTLDKIRFAMANLNEQQRELALTKIFGEQGKRFLAPLLNEGVYEDVVENAAKALSIQEKMKAQMDGQVGSANALAGTTRSTLSSAFTPALDVLTAVNQQLNKAVGATGEWIEGTGAWEKDGEKSLTRGAIAAAPTAIAGGIGAYGTYRMAKGALAARRVLKGTGGIRGLTSILTGRGTGGAGVGLGLPGEGALGAGALGAGQKVFVTNWPVGGGLGGMAAGTPAGAQRAGRLARAGTATTGWLKQDAMSLGTQATRTGKALNVAGKGLAVVGVALAGWEIGSWINDELIAPNQKVKGIVDAPFTAIIKGIHRLESEAAMIGMTKEEKAARRGVLSGAQAPTLSDSALAAKAAAQKIMAMQASGQAVPEALQIEALGGKAAYAQSKELAPMRDAEATHAASRLQALRAERDLATASGGRGAEFERKAAAAVPGGGETIREREEVGAIGVAAPKVEVNITVDQSGKELSREVKVTTPPDDLKREARRHGNV